MKLSDEENRSLCDGCDGCCKHIAIEIDKPTCKTDYDAIIWYLLHEGVEVFVEDGDWFVEVKTRCKALGDDKLCKIYKERPHICRSYSQDQCVRHGEEDPNDFKFTDHKQFIRWLKKKGKDYRFKRDYN